MSFSSSHPGDPIRVRKLARTSRNDPRAEARTEEYLEDAMKSRRTISFRTAHLAVLASLLCFAPSPVGAETSEQATLQLLMAQIAHLEERLAALESERNDTARTAERFIFNGFPIAVMSRKIQFYTKVIFNFGGIWDNHSITPVLILKLPT